MTDPRDLEPNGDDRLVRLLRTAGRRPGVPEERRLRAREAAREEWRRAVAEQRRTERRRTIRRTVLAAAAIVVVAIASWTAMRRSPAPSGGPAAAFGSATIERIVGAASVAGERGNADMRPAVAGELLAGPLDVSTADDGRLAMRLPTGHRVRIDRASRIEWPDRDRLRLIEGAVYVESDPDGIAASADLVVETPFGDVREIGTRYEVRVRPEAALRVRVRDGAVALDGGRDRRPVEIRAGREVELSPDGTVTGSPIAPDDPAWSWTGDVAEPFVLEGRTLAEFLEWARRERGARFRFVDPEDRTAARSIVLEGGSISSLSTEEAIHAVIAAAGWTAHPTPDAHVIGDTARFSR